MQTSNPDTPAPTHPGPTVTSRFTAHGEQWGVGCRAWRLADEAGLGVAEEEMAPGTREEWHVHDRATQYFYVLAGELAVHLSGGGMSSLRPGDGAVVRPGQPHQVAVLGAVSAHFLVISAPPTSSDRRPLAGPVSVSDAHSR